MTSSIIPNEDIYKPLQFTRIGQTWKGDKVTNTEATKLLAELQEWAAQYHHQDAQSFKDALGDLERLFTTVWTEIDESLQRLSLSKSHIGKGNIEDAFRYIGDANTMLNRWQDRGGRIGNVEF